MSNEVMPSVSEKLRNMSFVALLFVIYIHVRPIGVVTGSFYWFCSDLMRAAIGPFAVPFFFVASGYLLAGHGMDSHWWKAAVIKRFWSLIVPFVIMSIISFSVIYAGQWFGARFLKTPSPERLTAATVLSVFGINLFQYPYAMTLWFLRTLFIYTLVMFPFVLIITRGKRSASVLLFVMFLLSTLIRPTCSLFDATFRLNGLMYFILGAYLRYYPINYPSWVGRWHVLVGAALIMVCAAAYFMGFDMPQLQDTRILVMMGGIWLIIPARRWPAVMTSNIFSVYLVHALFLHLFYDVARHCWIQSYIGTWWGYWLIGVLTLVICISSVCAVRKLLPRFSEFLFGGI